MGSMKWYKNDKPLRLKENQCYSDSIKELDLSKFPIIDDFKILLTDHKRKMGIHIRYQSTSLGILSSFPWWDNVDKDLVGMTIDRVPLGSINQPYDDLEQGWQLVIWEKKDYVYIIEGSEPCCWEFDCWYRVDKRTYISEWERILSLFHK